MPYRQEAFSQIVEFLTASISERSSIDYLDVCLVEHKKPPSGRAYVQRSGPELDGRFDRRFFNTEILPNGREKVQAAPDLRRLRGRCSWYGH